MNDQPSSICPPLHVCIVTHNRADLLRELLESLATCEIPDELQNVFVVENGNSANSQSVSESFQNQLPIQFRSVASPVKSEALNRVIQEMENGFVLFLDDDVLPEPRWLMAYREAIMKRGSNCYYGGPNQPRYVESPKPWLLRFLPYSAAGFSKADILHNPEQTTAFLGFNWAADVDQIKRVGGFNPRFGPGTETGLGDETLLQIELKNAGLKSCFVEQAVTHHLVPPDRCSPKWCLGKAFLGGFNAGLFHFRACHDRSTTPRAMKSTLRYFYKRLRRQWSESSLSLMQRWFAIRVAFRSTAGFYQGLRKGNQYFEVPSQL